jgi:hypothetical protein
VFQVELDKVLVILFISVIFIGKEFDIEHEYHILPSMGSIFTESFRCENVNFLLSVYATG